MSRTRIRRTALLGTATAVVLSGVVSGTAHAAISSAESINVTGFTIVNAVTPPDTGSVTLTGEYSCTGHDGVNLGATFQVTAPIPATTTPTVTGLACPALNSSYSVTMTLPSGVSADAGRFEVGLRNAAQNQLAGDTGDVDRVAGTMNEAHVTQMSVNGGSIDVTYSARCTTPAPTVTIVLGQGTFPTPLSSTSTQTITGCSGTAFHTYTATVTPLTGSFVTGLIAANINMEGTSTQTGNGMSAIVT